MTPDSATGNQDFHNDPSQGYISYKKQNKEIIQVENQLISESKRKLEATNVRYLCKHQQNGQTWHEDLKIKGETFQDPMERG